MTTIQKMLIFFMLIPVTLILAGCAVNSPGDEVDPITIPSQPAGEAIKDTPDRTERLPPRTLPVPVDPGNPSDGKAVTGEVPSELLRSIIDDLIASTNSDRQAVEVIRDQAVIWSDGSLGCPQPGEFYTQSLVDGYWVVLQIGEEQYDYRASESGYFLLCQSGVDLPAPPEADPGEGSPPKQ